MKTAGLMLIACLLPALPAQPQDAPFAPRVTHVRADCGNFTVTVTFSKPVTLDGVYTLGNTASVIPGQNSYGASMAEVVLVTTRLNFGTSYPLTVTDVHELDTPANFLEPNPTQWSVGCAPDCASLSLASRAGPDGEVIIEWTTATTVLQSSSNLLSWSDLTEAASPHFVTSLLRAAQFFRLRCDDATGPAPVVLRQPDSMLSNAGSTVRLRAAITGLTPLHYQWLFNGTNLAGGTNQTLALAGLNCAQAGVYELRATNTFGAVTSRVAYVAASNDTCGLPFNATLAEPHARVLLLSSQNPPDFPLNTFLAQPPSQVLLLSSQNPPDFPLNTTVAQPPVATLLLSSQNPPDFPLNTTIAEPPTRVLLLSSQNPPDFHLNATVAQPPVATLLLSSQNPPDFPLNTTLARPPVFVLVGTNQTGGPFGDGKGAQAPAPAKLATP